MPKLAVAACICCLAEWTIAMPRLRLAGDFGIPVLACGSFLGGVNCDSVNLGTFIELSAADST